MPGGHGHEGNARDMLGVGGGGIYVCVTEKEREGQQEKGSAVYVPSRASERVCMQLDEKWSVD